MAQHKENQRSAKSNRSYRVRNVISVLFLIVALSALFYPVVANFYYQHKAQETVNHFQSEVKSTSKSEIKKQLDNAKLYNAKLYNQYIYDASQGIHLTGKIPDYDQTLNIDNHGMMGYITVPQIGIKDIPIYHGDSETTLAEGAGHIQQTSLPIGGVNTHTVLAAHSGQVNDTLFSDIQYLKKGDVFYITTLNLKLKYKVINKKVVWPTDISTLNIVKGKDLATLVTCYPTGINDHRLLVTGERIPLNEVTKSEHVQRNFWTYRNLVVLGSGLVGLLALLWLLLLAFRGKRWYRADLQKLEKPDLSLSQAGEFGEGVYFTMSKKLAEQEARDLGDDAVVNVYHFRKEKKDTKYLIYYKRTENWQKFVEAIAGGYYEGKAHDFVKGPHARPEIKVRQKDLQLALQSANACEKLKFVKSYKI
ncbi:MAG: class C sortase [Streptococcaceae bacterium]|jgi:sortase A|nr:class C sortase [Streptococcaceae bacterium]